MTIRQNQNRTWELIGLLAVLSLGSADLSAKGATAGKGTGAPEESAAPRAQQTSGSDPAEGWLSSVQENIQKAEYAITWQDHTYLKDVKASWQAPNRAHNFRTYFTEDGIRVVPRTEEKPSWEWGISLLPLPVDSSRHSVDVEANDQLRAAGYRLPATVSENRIEFDRGWIKEWYVNSPEGLEQGSTINSPPVQFKVQSSKFKVENEDMGRGQDNFEPETLNLELQLSGNLHPVLAEDGGSVRFRHEGLEGLTMTLLSAVDAAGRELPARFEGWGDPLTSRLSPLTGSMGGIRIVVNVEGADYPVTLRSLSTTPDWTKNGGSYGDGFGCSVSGAGDVNGDGFNDVIVGAKWVSSTKGAAYVYLGSASGLAGSAVWSETSGQNNSNFGTYVATAGDVNGDGYSDVIVGTPYYDSGQTDEGMVFAYHGSAAGLDHTGNGTCPGNADWCAQIDRNNAWFGTSVASAGDVNGDGYGDVIVGAPNYNNGYTQQGAAFVFHGSASGLSASPAWTEEGIDGYDELGQSVALAGDVNGDGYSDVIVGAPGATVTYSSQGYAYVYHGSGSGLPASPNRSLTLSASLCNFGYSVATAGDVNGDGYADVIVGAPWYGTYDSGAAFVFLGGAAGVSSTESWSKTGNGGDVEYGRSVATAGDVNADGYADILVGAPCDVSTACDGAVFAFYGGPAGPSTTTSWQYSAPPVTGYRLGDSVHTAGDVNGDGYSDIIVGADYYDSLRGRAYAFYGSPQGLTAAVALVDEGDQADASLGFSVATAGDVNGDGFGDVVAGAPNYDGGMTDEGRVTVYYGTATGLNFTPAWTKEGEQWYAYFGAAVAGAGDVNGDGFGDVIVGANGYNGALTNEGMAAVYHGSATGLPSAADWSALGNQTNAGFGTAVASAGDVNGDGFGDVVIGTPQFDRGETNEGIAVVYQGSSAGLGGSPSWFGEGNQDGALYGMSVAEAGDINRDGYSDIVVGAPGYDAGQADEGMAFAYYGSPSGLFPSADWAAQGDQTAAAFGQSVAGAGDVNGDGFSDVLIGAPAFDNGENDEGEASLFLGSASGLAAGRSWRWEGNQADAHAGSTVAGLGDLNGDGFADALIGADAFDNGQTDEGYIWIFLGSAAGLPGTLSWGREINAAGAAFGRGATAGDVNGDGFADIVVGAPAYANGQTGEGGIFIYYGGVSGGAPRALRLKQKEAVGSARISRLGASDIPDAFSLEALAFTPFGRGKVKLETEVKPLETPLNHTGIQTYPPSWTSTGVGGATIAVPITGLQSNAAYHWCARVKYDPVTLPFQTAGRWLVNPWDGRQEADLKIVDDGDGDGIPGFADNCPGLSNPGQEDGDGDGSGDACDSTTLALVKSDSKDPICLGESMTYTLQVTNGGAGTEHASGVTVADTLPPQFSVAPVDQTDADNTATGFGGGGHLETQWDAVNSWVELTAAGQTAGSGTFTSRVMDAGRPVEWTTLSWIPQRPVYKELPGSGGVESGYPEGNISMAGNALLLHVNQVAGATLFADASGNGRNGTCSGGGCPLSGAAGMLGTAITFDGVNDCVDTSTFDITDSFTIGMWANVENTSKDQALVGKHDGSGGNLVLMGLYNGGYHVRIRTDTYEGGAIAAGWQHLVITGEYINSTTTRVRYYRNGGLLWQNDLSAVVGNVGGGLAWTLGQDWDSVPIERTDFFDGSMDEVFIMNRLMSATEVSDIYRRGALRLKFQARSCNDPACSGELFRGPDGSPWTSYSEWDNAALTPPSMVLYPPPMNRYFQYQAVLETVNAALSPALKSVVAGPGHGGTITASQGSCVLEGQGVNCDLGLVPAGGSATVTITGVWTAAGTLNNSASMTLNETDTTPEDNAPTQSTWVDAADGDGDGVCNAVDNCPAISNPGQENNDADAQGDVCDSDDDNDAVPDGADCAPFNAALWAAPSVVLNFRVTKAESDNLTWTAPAAPGCAVPAYDVLRSGTAADFSGAECVESDGTDRVATDATVPTPILFYLIRVENGCGSNMGSDSGGLPRTGKTCP